MEDFGYVPCQECGQPRNFHKWDKCPHLDGAGSVESWGPGTYIKKAVSYTGAERRVKERRVSRHDGQCVSCGQLFKASPAEFACQACLKQYGT
jgi:hypothetical protein